MKLSLALLAILLIVSLCAYPIIYADLYAEHTTVELTENVLYGDVSEAEGLYVKVHTHCDHRLFWDTTYTFGSKSVTETEFEFMANRSYYRGETPDNRYDGIEMWVNVNIGMSSNAGIEFDDWQMGRVFTDVASRAENNTSYTETIKLADYYEHYPIEVSIRLPYMKYRWEDGKKSVEQYITNRDTVLNRAIAEKFRIPVQPDEEYEAVVQKNSAGEVVEAYINQIKGRSFGLWSTGVATDNSCLFTVQGVVGYDGNVDYSQLEQGFGLYRLPFEVAEDDKNCILINPDNIEMVYPIDDGVRVTDISESPDKSKILITTQESDAYYMTVLDAKTFKELQRIVLIETDEENNYYTSFRYDDYIVSLTFGNKFNVITRTPEGLYETSLSGSYDTYTTHDIYGINVDYKSEMYYDGEKLYMVTLLNDKTGEYHYNYSGFALTVYDESGLLYAGEYMSSLNKAAPKKEQMICQPADTPFETGKK